MTINEIRTKLDSIINSGMACGEDVFKTMFCASQELDQYERLLDKTRWHQAVDGFPDNGKVVLMEFSNSKYPVIGYYSKTYDCVYSLTGGQYPNSILVRWMFLPKDWE